MSSRAGAGGREAGRARVPAAPRPLTAAFLEISSQILRLENISTLTELVVLVPHPLEPGGHARVLLEERVLGPECVVGQRVEVDSSTQR